MVTQHLLGLSYRTSFLIRCRLPAAVEAGTNRLPRRLHFQPPEYTPLARRHGIQGTVYLQAVIDEEGNVRCVRPLRGLPMGLTESAIRRAKASKYEPARWDGKPTPFVLTMTTSFNVGRTRTLRHIPTTPVIP